RRRNQSRWQIIVLSWDQSGSAGKAEYGDGVSELRRLAAYESVRERRFSTAQLEKIKGRNPSTSARRVGTGQVGWLRGPLSVESERRSATASCVGARDGGRTRHLAVRRAAEQS